MTLQPMASLAVHPPLRALPALARELRRVLEVQVHAVQDDLSWGMGTCHY
jgi:hypothetical protein